MARADQITRELDVLAHELPKVTRATIADRHEVLEAIFELQGAAMRWLAEAEH
jgi:hypothetical protein